jgi:peptidyl-prolyl cis-trans isomerase SurA
MKKILFLTLLINIIFLPAAAEVLDKIIAKVGREIILQSELIQRLQQMEAAGLMTENVSQYDVLNDMIESKLILQRAKKDKYETDQEQIRSMAEEQIRSVSAQFPSQEVFLNELKKAKLTVIELKEYYIEMITEQNLKEQIINKEIRNKIHITEAEVEEFYQEKKDEIPLKPEMIEIGMILRKIEPSQQTRKKVLLEINKIRQKLIEGEDFAELAKKNSECPSSAGGGNLGFFGRGSMVKPFEEAAFALIPGEISEVVETQFGYHIIKMDEKKDNEIKVSHILKKIEATEEDIKATIILMENILQKLNEGDDFKELARTYSQDDSTAVKGGVIGEFVPENVPELFKEHLEKIKVGEHTGLIREDTELYIFSKLSLVPSRPYNYTEIYDRLKDLVSSQKEIELYNNWINDLVKNSYVEILLEE